jgi:hypothetical protein
MRESRAYLGYFRQFILLYLFFLIVGAVIGYALQKKIPDIYTTEMTFEVWQPALSCPTQELVQAADHITQISRSPNLSRQLFGPSTASLEISSVRLAPFAVRTRISSRSEQLLAQEAPKLSQYLIRSYPLQKIGMDYTYTTMSNPLIGVIIGAGVGLLTAAIVSFFLIFFSHF